MPPCSVMGRLPPRRFSVERLPVSSTNKVPPGFRVMAPVPPILPVPVPPSNPDPTVKVPAFTVSGPTKTLLSFSIKTRPTSILVTEPTAPSADPMELKITAALPANVSA